MGPTHEKFAASFLNGIVAAVKDARSKASSAPPPSPSARGRGSPHGNQGSPREGGSSSDKKSWIGVGKRGRGGGGFMSGNWRDIIVSVALGDGVTVFSI